jgi:hypothetical protein
VIRADPVRELTVGRPAGAYGRHFISSGSGLVRTGDYMYVIADDERELAVFAAEGDAPGRLVRFLPGELPADPDERKRLKPDVEALALLPAMGVGSEMLLALESGSRPQRRGGVLWRLDERGGLAGEPVRLDLAALYAALEREIADLNVEGATVAGEQLLLFQRGNGHAGVNAVVALDLSMALRHLAGGAIGPETIREVRRHDIGEIDGVRLCFSDATALADGAIVFTAVAEAGDDTYVDARCAGSAVGWLSSAEKLEGWEALDPPAKVEGVEAHVEGDAVVLLMVADGDDPGEPSPLLAAQLPRSFGPG